MAVMSLDGLRLALTTLTVAPVRSGRVDRATAGRAMAWAPAVGLAVGLVGDAVLVIARLLHLGPLLSAVLTVGALAAVTRALHLDGLADTADGLGCGRPAEEALRVMRKPDVGPFGVVALVLVLLTQVAALARAESLGRGFLAVALAAVTGRLAVTWACRSGEVAARSEGLGALVAGTVRPWVAIVVAVAVALATAAAGRYSTSGMLLPLAALAAGLVVAAALEWHVARRLGGITGDVLGALVETSTAASLVVMAFGLP